jgi:hypothetical protein
MALKVNDKIYKRKVKKLQRYVRNTLPNKSLKEMQRVTPIGKTKNAKNNTKIKSNTNRGFTLIGDYDYSGVIDQGLYPNPPVAGTGKTSGGYSIKNLSKARPRKGLLDPTVAFIEKTLKKVIRRL